jgi:hypothetical protein
MLILWLEENILHTYEPEKRKELQNIDSPSWDIIFKNYCVSCSSPIKTTEAIDQLEWLLGVAVRLTYNKESKYKPNIYNYINCLIFLHTKCFCL